MTKHYEVWKAPDGQFDENESDPWADRGVFPTGELMDVKSDPDEAEQLKEDLEDFIPSERFGERESESSPTPGRESGDDRPGETVEEAPYTFFISERLVE